MKQKNAYALLSALVLIVIFSYLSIKIVQNSSFSNKINHLKYMELQAQIYLKNIKQNIQSNPSLNDNRFTLDIQMQDFNITHNIYHIYLKSTDDSHVSLYDNIKVIK